MRLKKPVMLFLLTSIGLITLPHVNNIPLPLFVFFWIMLGWRFVGIWQPQILPNTWILLLLFVFSIGLIYFLKLGILGRDAGTAILITALGLKILEAKSAKEIFVITCLAFIVVVTLFLYQQSILLALYILCVSCVLLATLIFINNFNTRLPTALKTSATIMAQAIPLALALFLLFPRFQPPSWMTLDIKQAALTGLSDSLEPGAISRLGQSEELAFRVKFYGPLPPREQRYWRGPVLSKTDGKRWTEIKKPLYLVEPVDYRGAAYRYTLLMEPQNNRWVYALDLPADYGQALEQNSQYQLTTTNNPQLRWEYTVTSYTDYDTGLLDQRQKADNLQLPGEISPKIRAFIERLRGFDAPPETFIDNLLEHFHTQDFHYTLKPPLMTANPVEDFLFRHRRGFCSHYATAFVYLMRAAGIPARVVTGYLGGALNSVGGFFEVKQANAHAWSEVWLENRGWVRYDPTTSVAPERVEPDTLNNAAAIDNFATLDVSFVNRWLKQGKQTWQAIDYSWQRWVINYDNINQNSFLQALGIKNIYELIYALIYVTLFILAVLAWFLLRPKEKPRDPVLQYYLKFCSIIRKQTGTALETGEGPASFARRIKTLNPDNAADIDRITALYLKLRYLPNAQPGDFVLFKRLIKQFK